MLHLSVISTKETLITFASIVLMASLLFLCTSAYAQTRQDTNSSSRPMTTTIPTVRYAQTRQDTNSSSRPMTTTIPTARLQKTIPL